MVLGGAGYIGSHTVYELIAAGENVVVVDNLETGFRKAVHPDAKFYLGDIRDKAFIDSVFEKEEIDGVIHFAANSQVGESMVNPLKYYNNNLCGTEVLLESMVAHGINKIVFSSTAATYGEPDRIPILETDRTVPTNCYGETKLSMEKMFKWTANAHDLRFVSLRYFNACGAHPNGKIGDAHNPETHLIPLILQVPNGKRKSKHIEPHLHNALEIVCVTNGALELGVGQELYHMEKGDIGFVFPDIIHHYQVLTPGVNTAIYLIASPLVISKFADIMQSMAPEYPIIRAEKVEQEVYRVINAILETEQPDITVAQAYLQIVLARCMGKLNLVEKSNVGNRDLIYQTVSYISANFKKKFSLEEMAKDLGVSKYVLSRLFSQIFHRNFNQYLNDARLIKT